MNMPDPNTRSRVPIQCGFMAMGNMMAVKVIPVMRIHRPLPICSLPRSASPLTMASREQIMVSNRDQCPADKEQGRQPTAAGHHCKQTGQGFEK